MPGKAFTIVELMALLGYSDYRLRYLLAKLDVRPVSDSRPMRFDQETVERLREAGPGRGQSVPKVASAIAEAQLDILRERVTLADTQASTAIDVLARYIGELEARCLANKV